MTDLGKVVLGILSKAKEIMKSKKPIKVADIITDYVQIFNQEDFILKKRYKVAKVKFNLNILSVFDFNFRKVAVNLRQCRVLRL
jgi:hypothetical protein